MNPDTLLQAVLDKAVRVLVGRPNRNIQMVVDQAADEVLKGKLELTRSSRRTLMTMLEEREPGTGKPVNTRWASYHYDRRA